MDDLNEFIQALEENKGGLYVYTLKNAADAEETFLKLIFQPLLGMNNNVVELVVIGIDITEEVQSKNEIEEALKIQDEVFTNISHELKTPLSVIFSAVQLMEMYLKNNLIENNRVIYILC